MTYIPDARRFWEALIAKNRRAMDKWINILLATLTAEMGSKATPPILLTGVPLDKEGWVLNEDTSLYEYSFEDTGISDSIRVDATPSDATSESIAITAEVRARTLSSTGRVTFYAGSAPSDDIIVDLLLTHVTVVL